MSGERERATLEFIRDGIEEYRKRDISLDMLLDGIESRLAAALAGPPAEGEGELCCAADGWAGLEHAKNCRNRSCCESEHEHDPVSGCCMACDCWGTGMLAARPTPPPPEGGGAHHVCGLQGFGALGDTCPGCQEHKGCAGNHVSGQGQDAV